MISIENKLFRLDTKDTSYVFGITDKGHPEHIYYGKRINDFSIEGAKLKNTIMLGTTVDYDKTIAYSLDTLPLEYSGIGKGDYRHTPIELIMPDGSFVCDFIYDSHRVSDTPYSEDTPLPFATGDGECLYITLKDKKYPDISLILSYSVFYESNVIARNIKLENKGDSDVIIRKLMSFMLDLPTSDYDMLTLDGGWAKEAHAHKREVSFGILINDSTTGDSSNRHNPAFMLIKKGACEEWGDAYGFNLIYSGNHYSAVERGNHDTLRVMSGINPYCFLWKLKSGESFVTPQAVMSYSHLGTNSLSHNMHSFVNNHIIRENFKFSERPVVINNWEATFFNFNARKLLALARKAKMLGVEMFVLDDGWFGKRDSDTRGLGDWVVNEKKLSGSMGKLARKINKMGLSFGLWFEPECVNEDSDLYRAHPDWAIQVPGRRKSYGRNQLVLDLTRREVRDYIVNSVNSVLNSANIKYVKWDYNRHISDMYSPSLKNQGEFFHRYILGLYEVLDRIFNKAHKDILFESCSSGGNRFDLGMLCFSPQIWTSDDTDARERMDIQGGIYHFYPQSCVSNHVSMTPNQQTLRDIALSTRFNVAAFGALGYELDFGELTPNERKQIKSQIEFYKAHRKAFLYGKLSRYSPAPDRLSWQVCDEDKIIASIYNTDYHASPARDCLKILDAKHNTVYKVKSVEQKLKISRFGSLIKHVSPVPVKADGGLMRFVNKHFAMVDGKEEYICSGELLSHGINLSMQYSGTGYHKDIRILGDNGSTMYLITEENKENTENERKL